MWVVLIAAAVAVVVVVLDKRSGVSLMGVQFRVERVNIFGIEQRVGGCENGRHVR